MQRCEVASKVKTKHKQVRMKPAMWQAMRRAAHREGISANLWVEDAIQQKLDRKLKTRLAPRWTKKKKKT